MITTEGIQTMASPGEEPAKEYKFLVEVDDNLKCQICLEVARDPLQHEECGKLFCKDCLERHGKNKPCPNCREEASRYYVDKRGKRDIEALLVKCGADKKCRWVGTVGTVEAHVATCEFTLVPCPNQCKSKVETNNYMRKELDQHLKFECPNRIYKCQYCSKEDTYATITQIHDDACEMKPIPCPNEECQATIERGLVGDHVEHVCDYTVLPCKYKSFGCNVERKRRDMAAHEHDDKQRHLDMAMDATLEMMKDITKLKSENEKVKTEVTKLSSAVNVHHFSQMFTLKDYKKVRKNKGHIKFSPFYFEPRSYHVCVWVDAEGEGEGKGTHISVYMTIVKGDYDAELKWPLLGDITFVLLNQLEDKNHHTESFPLTAELDARVGNISGSEAWGFPKFIPLTDLNFNPVKNTQYLKDDTLYFKMNVELNK